MTPQPAINEELLQEFLVRDGNSSKHIPFERSGPQ